jgi:hypothetical protein
LVNQILDQERVDIIRARVGSNPKRARLSSWRRSDKELPIIDLEIEWVRFSTLNHRTKAEQIREVRRSGYPDLFSSDPLGPLAQDAQFAILKSQQGFFDLAEDIKERTQQEPAVVTSEGVLINGNRRAAALRYLYQEENHRDSKYVKCYVLPEDATAAEITDLETELQIARDFWEEYSWINEAMLIEELYMRENRDFERVAKIMHREQSDIRSKYERIQQVNQLVALSGGAYLHIDFEPQNSAFEELAKHIKSKPNESESVRLTYFLGILSGVKYRDLRHLRIPNASQLVQDEIASDSALAPLLGGQDLTTPNITAPDGMGEVDDNQFLDDFLGQQKNDGLSSILSTIATKRRNEEVDISGQRVVIDDLCRSIKSVIEAVAAESHEGQRDQDTLSAPIIRLANAAKEIDRAKQGLTRARALLGWNEANFKTKLVELKDLILKLEGES